MKAGEICPDCKQPLQESKGNKPRINCATYECELKYHSEKRKERWRRMKAAGWTSTKIKKAQAKSRARKQNGLAKDV